MTSDQDPMDTQLADLRTIPLDDLIGPHGRLLPELASYAEALIHQVERPRPNIGTGPPGRAD